MEQRPDAPFGRILTAVITPFSSDGSIDYSAFFRLVKHLGQNGSEGMVVGGTTGESPTLSRPEKIALFSAAVDASKSSMNIVAGVGTYNTRESVDLAKAAADAGVDGVMAVTPYYSKPPQAGIAEHMVAIADATELPLMLYNIPGRTATKIELNTLIELAGHPRITSVKDAVEDNDWSRRAIGSLPEGFAVYSGSDAMTRELVEAGAVGVVSVASHLAGVTISDMVNAVIDGDSEKARTLDDLLQPLVEALFAEPNPMPLKAGLTAYWDSVGTPRLPLLAAREGTADAIGTALEAINEYRDR
ncbi:MAG: 4-hydroxy-tetrahydrodipicolinate synthase [Acidimicrobiia bacterium]|nr:MAG: 4-hydroxy-tetrahydrodipicolinate synthase [Acidimicrobiia bacterium]